MNKNILRFTRTFEAPRQLVFNCMIDPAHLTHFWGPIGVTTPQDTITVEPRVGGAFTSIMVNDADGSTYPTNARYIEVKPPERLSWIEDHTRMIVTIIFTELGTHRTQVDIEQSNVPAPMMDPAAQAGFLTSLDRFDTYLAQHAGANR